MMWFKIFAAASFSALALAGCTPTVVVRTQCAPLVAYDQPYMDRLADEVKALPDNSAVVRAIVDYRQLRDIIRACKE